LLYLLFFSWSGNIFLTLLTEDLKSSDEKPGLQIPTNKHATNIADTIFLLVRNIFLTLLTEDLKSSDEKPGLQIPTNRRATNIANT